MSKGLDGHPASGGWKLSSGWLHFEVRVGSFSTELCCPRHVQFTPGRDRWSRHPGSVMTLRVISIVTSG
jgi:hypothetical protein